MLLVTSESERQWVKKRLVMQTAHREQKILIELEVPAQVLFFLETWPVLALIDSCGIDDYHSGKYFGTLDTI
jgi:hypothetical protein